ncbi:hypothetical protein D3C85_1386060 [compost metagenome]
MRAPDGADNAIRSAAKEISLSLSDIITDTVREQIEASPVPMSPADQEQALPINQLARIERERGLSPAEAMSEAKRGMEIIDERIQYPAEPQPQKLSTENVRNTLELMLRQIEKNKGSN